MNIYNFIENARKAWKESTTEGDRGIGLQAIRVVEQEYEKTEIHNANLRLKEVEEKLAECQKDLLVERNKSRKRHNELTDKNIVIEKLRITIERRKERHNQLIEFVTEVVASNKDSGNKLQLILNKIKNP